MRTYGTLFSGAVLCGILAFIAMGTSSCHRPVKPGALVGKWTLVASGFEPMETVVPNDRFSGWVTFNRDMSYEMTMHEKGRPRATYRSGTYSVEGSILKTVTGAKITSSRITYQGSYLVTVTRQLRSKQDFYIYYRRVPVPEKLGELSP